MTKYWEDWRNKKYLHDYGLDAVLERAVKESRAQFIRHIVNTVRRNTNKIDKIFCDWKKNRRKKTNKLNGDF